MAKIFISYRRADNAAFAGRIYDRLTAKFGRKNVFKDVDDIPPGVEFPEYIQSSLRECQIMIAIIGPGWVGAEDSQENRRLNDPADFVRVEIESALNLGLVLIPVLIDHAIMPTVDELPDSLQRLARINAIEVRNDPDFTRDAERLSTVIERTVATARRTPRSGERSAVAKARPQSTPRATKSSEAAGRAQTERTPSSASASRPLRALVALAAGAVLALALLASGLALIPSVAARLFPAPKSTATVGTLQTRTVTRVPTTTPIPAGFYTILGASGAYTIIAPNSWTRTNYVDNSSGAPDYWEQFMAAKSGPYPPMVLIEAWAGLKYKTYDELISNQLQSTTYTSSTQTVDGLACARGDFRRDTPGGTDYSAVLVCKPPSGPYAYMFDLSDKDSDFQSAYQTYFSHMLASFQSFQYSSS